MEVMEMLSDIMEKVRANGDMFFLKLDMERLKDIYTVMITFPMSKGKEMIRVDHHDLREALTRLSQQYDAALSG